MRSRNDSNVAVVEFPGKEALLCHAGHECHLFRAYLGQYGQRFFVLNGFLYVATTPKVVEFVDVPTHVERVERTKLTPIALGRSVIPVHTECGQCAPVRTADIPGWDEDGLADVYPSVSYSLEIDGNCVNKITPLRLQSREELEADYPAE